MTNLNRIFLSPPHMSGEEMRFVREAFESNYIAPLGPQVDAFEREFAEYVGIKHCVAVSSGTAAMHLAMRILGVGQGDEVIASILTFIGSVTPATFQNAKLTFVDSDRTTWNMDTGLLKKTLEDRKKSGKMPEVIVPTDLYGQCVDYKRIFEISEEYGVPVVADSAEALGSFYFIKSKSKNLTADKGDKNKKLLHAGSGAKLAVFSFNGNKIITTSGGGMLASDDKGLIEHARFLSQQARENFAHYEHVEIGYNYRMSNILAAIGLGQLRSLDERVKRKRQIFDYYKNALDGLSGIEFMPEPEWSRSNRWLTVVLIAPEEFGADREMVRLALEAENIESRPVWKPMHLQPVFNLQINADFKGQQNNIQNSKLKTQNYPARVVGGEVAEDLFERGLCLPSGTAMTNFDLDRVIETILKCRK